MNGIASRFLWSGIALLAIIAGGALSILSWLGICTEACAESHKYHLYGINLGPIGLLYFIALGTCRLLSNRIPSIIQNSLLCAGLGAEAFFIYVQKYQIGTWCPICLGIAGCVVIAALAHLEESKRSLHMSTIAKKLAPLSLVFVLTFVVSFLGLAKTDPIHAAEGSIQDQIAFGPKNTPIDIYVITSWSCPACKRAGPTIEAMAPRLMEKGRLTFIDYPEDLKSLNYIPYNLAFMIQDKAKYIQLHGALRDLSSTTDSPTEEQIHDAASKYGATFRELPYATVEVGIQYFKDIVEKYKVSDLPTIVIVDNITKEQKQLVGTSQISENNIMTAIDDLQKKNQ